MRSIKTILLLAAVSLVLSPSVIASDKFSEAELDDLLARIALYPDPLLAQMLPAATFVEQLDEAQRLLGGYANDDLVDQQTWDVSVKAVAHYPSVLARMMEQQDWIVAVGQAYVEQPGDVAASIQRLRRLAYNAGVLFTTPEQKVNAESDYISIEPTQADAIYEPVYDAGYGYDYVYGGVPTWTWGPMRFGRRLAIGVWLSRAWRWGDNAGIYYHGWRGNAGWVGYSRSAVNVNNGTYVNDGLKNVNVDRNISSRSVTAYRDALQSVRSNQASIATINNAVRQNSENFERQNPGTNFDGSPRGNGLADFRPPEGGGGMNRDWQGGRDRGGLRDGRLDDFRGRDGRGDRLGDRDGRLDDISNRDIANRQRERGAASRATAAPVMRGGGGGRRR
jgi:hypothetical protein